MIVPITVAATKKAVWTKNITIAMMGSESELARHRRPNMSSCGMF